MNPDHNCPHQSSVLFCSGCLLILSDTPQQQTWLKGDVTAHQEVLFSVARTQSICFTGFLSVYKLFKVIYGTQQLPHDAHTGRDM